MHYVLKDRQLMSSNRWMDPVWAQSSVLKESAFGGSKLNGKVGLNVNALIVPLTRESSAIFPGRCQAPGCLSRYRLAGGNSYLTISRFPPDGLMPLMVVDSEGISCGHRGPGSRCLASDL